jgi:hypothetical protein
MLLLPTCCRNACHMPTSTGARLWRTVKHTAYDAHSTLRQTRSGKSRRSGPQTRHTERHKLFLKAAASVWLQGTDVELCRLLNLPHVHCAPDHCRQAGATQTA